MPSNKRASAVEGYGEKAEEGLVDEGDGWVSTPADRSALDGEDIPSLSPNNAASKAAERSPAGDEEDDDDIPDIDDLTLEDSQQDEVCVQSLNLILKHRVAGRVMTSWHYCRQQSAKNKPQRNRTALCTHARMI